MKHIFTIHSHITFLAAIGTVIYEDIDTNDVLLICGSRYQPNVNESFKGKIVSAYDTLEASFSPFKKLKHWNYTNSVNAFIQELTQGDDFIAYVDLMSVFNRYLVMHTKCTQFHIIEEGIVNYADYDDFMLWTADLRKFQWQWKGLKQFNEILNGCVRLLRGRSLRLLAMPIHPNLYTLHRGVNAYCFSECAFQYTKPEKKFFLNWDTLDQYVHISESTYPDNSWFWIGDTLCKSYAINMDHYENALKQLLEKINPNKEKNLIYLKFRGPESQEEKLLTIKYLANYNFKVKMLGAEVIMELVFLKSKKLTVCGISSSLLIYANLMGHTTHSLYRYIPDEYGVSLNKNYTTISKKTGFL